MLCWNIVFRSNVSTFCIIMAKTKNVPKNNHSVVAGSSSSLVISPARKAVLASIFTARAQKKKREQAVQQLEDDAEMARQLQAAEWEYDASASITIDDDDDDLPSDDALLQAVDDMAAKLTTTVKGVRLSTDEATMLGYPAGVEIEDSQPPPPPRRIEKRLARTSAPAIVNLPPEKAEDVEPDDVPSTQPRPPSPSVLRPVVSLQAGHEEEESTYCEMRRVVRRPAPPPVPALPPAQEPVLFSQLLKFYKNPRLDADGQHEPAWPKRLRAGYGCFKLFADGPYTVLPGARTPVYTGIRVQFPAGCMGVIHGLSLNAWHGHDVVGTVVDPAATGPMRVIAWNNSLEPWAIGPGDEIGLLMITATANPDVMLMDD